MEKISELEKSLAEVRTRLGVIEKAIEAAEIRVSQFQEKMAQALPSLKASEDRLVEIKNQLGQEN
ncbi:hypothetical protein GW916_01335 [bacterium]|nr:hypothetical protein [bacterium]